MLIADRIGRRGRDRMAVNQCLSQLTLWVRISLRRGVLDTTLCEKVCVCDLLNRVGLVYGVKRHFQQYFSYIGVVSFIGGGNRCTGRKPPTCRKSQTHTFSHNVVSSTPRLSGIRTHNVSCDRH
jgi:hypothetical protein